MRLFQTHLRLHLRNAGYVRFPFDGQGNAAITRISFDMHVRRDSVKVDEWDLRAQKCHRCHEPQAIYYTGWP